MPDISPLPENLLPSGADTLLTISGLGGFEFQCRGAVQTAAVIKQAQQQVRTINANLIDISNHAFRKYSSKITVTDSSAMPVDGLFPGMQVTVDCAFTFAYLTGNPGSPFRPEVSGSSYVRGRYTFYRPVMTFLVMDVNQSFDEWKSDYTTEIDLEEV